MQSKQRIFRVRRSYNQWVNNQTLEDYALRFTAKASRRWSLSRVANTALGAISFLALEAIGGAITLSYGFSNAALAILIVSTIIFLSGLPICYYAAKFGVDIDLLTRGAGFGYIGSTITSLIYASFTFIFFALEAVIMAMALKIIFGVPLVWGYVLCSIVVIPIVIHGITLISRFQVWTQPLWVVLQIAPFIYIFISEYSSVVSWTEYRGLQDSHQGEVSLIYLGAASAVLFSLMAQIGEQVDYLRFLPQKTADNSIRWWCAVIAGGPGWVIVGALKIFAGGLLAVIALNQNVPPELATDPSQMYLIAYGLFIKNPEFAAALAGFFVVISQLKINVTNAYAGSIAWSNFFSRLTHSHPGRVVWLVFNVVIAMVLMELGVYHALENTLGVYAVVAVAWVSALVADLLINKPLGLSPKHIEYKRAHLYDVNPVGVGGMAISSVLGLLCYVGIFGELLQALSHFITLLSALVLCPLIAILTHSKYYIARESTDLIFRSEAENTECCICQNAYEKEDIAYCPAYEGAICSLCCSLDARCRDLCKSASRFSDLVTGALGYLFPSRRVGSLDIKLLQFIGLLCSIGVIVGVLLIMVYLQATTQQFTDSTLLVNTLWKVFFILLIISGVVAWLFVLANESRRVAQDESLRQTALLQQEIDAHSKTDLQLQEAKERAEAANDAKSRYLTGISHELRTPLNSVMGYAQLLELSADLPDDKRHQVSVIRRSSEHLADLIEGLLDISKIEAGRLDIHRGQVRISTLIEQIVHMFRLQAEQKGLSFSYQCHSRLPEHVITDEKRLRQILINLLSNAVKFTHLGGVQLSVKYRNEVAEIQVSDTGVGIAEAERERIFRPFERVLASGAPATHGTGLGLTITRLLVDILGGDIEVSDNPAGQGTRFTVWLMLSSVVEVNSPRETYKRVLGYKGPCLSVMVVDDDTLHRRLIADVLNPLGFNVVESSSAQHCLEACQQQLPDLFLLDISMPLISGLELAARLRSSYSIRPILMVSAVVKQSEGLEAITVEEDRSYDDYLIKPLNIETLIAKIGQQLDVVWIYEADEAQSRLNSKSFAGSSVVPEFSFKDLPNIEVLRELHQLADIGHLSALRKRVMELKQDKTVGDNFINQMTMLVNNVKFEAIKDLLNVTDISLS